MSRSRSWQIHSSSFRGLSLSTGGSLGSGHSKRQSDQAEAALDLAGGFQDPYPNPQTGKHGCVQTRPTPLIIRSHRSQFTAGLLAKAR